MRAKGDPTYYRGMTYFYEYELYDVDVDVDVTKIGYFLLWIFVATSSVIKSAILKLVFTSFS